MSSTMASGDKARAWNGPERFDEVVGQDRAVNALRRWVLEKETGGLILCGPNGVGKRTLAHLLAKAIYCQDGLADGSPCGKCDHCRNIDDGRLMVGYVRFDAANSLKEEKLRSFVVDIRGNSLADEQVIIVENVDRFEPSKIDIFLKTLEETPAKTTFVLLATQISRVRPAVRSRCSPHLFVRPLTKQQTHELAMRLSAALGLQLKEDVLSLVALLSRRLPGRLADALGRLVGMKGVALADALRILDLDWPDDMVAYWSTLLSGHEADATLRAKIAGPDPAESMRRLRSLLNHFFAHVCSKPAVDFVADPALVYMDEGAWHRLVRQLDETAVVTAMSRSELWRALAVTCLSSDHENAVEAIAAATAELGALAAN